MSKGNVGELYKQKVEAVHKQMAEEMITICKQLGQKLRDETAARTPVDHGDLREKWAVMPVEKKEDKYIISITNPAKYAAYVEFGYMQRPGMRLKMKEVNGKLRFVQFLGYARQYKLGETTGKAQPDKDGYIVIITRKRFIPGRFMARQGLEETKKTHWPKVKRYLLKRMKRNWEAL